MKVNPQDLHQYKFFADISVSAAAIATAEVSRTAAPKGRNFGAR
jgi:hypothetical protein